MKICNLILYKLIMFNLMVSAQTPLPVKFGTETYEIVKADYPGSAISSSVTDDMAFFYEHFNQNDYAKYRAYYYNNSCIASIEDFKNWRAQISKDIITPEARYSAYSASDTLSLIVYTRGSAGSKHYFPLMLQQKNKKWYLLEPGKSEKLLAFKMFLTFVHPEFIREFLMHPAEMKSLYMASIFTAGEELNGDLMMNIYADRYDPSSARNTLSQDAFHGIAELPQDFRETLSSEIALIAAEYNIPSSKTTILQNMCREGNSNTALSKIAEWSGTPDVIEIADKFHARINDTFKKN